MTGMRVSLRSCQLNQLDLEGISTHSPFPNYMLKEGSVKRDRWRNVRPIAHTLRSSRKRLLS